MLKRLIIMLGILSAFLIADDQSLNHVFSQGVEYYQDGDYKASLEAFNSILAQGYDSWELYYNLGNIYYKQKDYGLALLHYRKALKLMPKNEDVLYNIELTRLHFKDKIEKIELMPVVEWVKNVRRLPSIKLLAWISVLFWLFFSVIISLKISNVNNAMVNKLTNLTSILLVTIAVIASTGWFIDRILSDGEQHIVILVDEVPVRSAPLENSEVLFKLHEGTEGKIINTVNEWIEFKLEDGKSAWIHESNIGIY